jgi:hypothetical protein
MKERPSWKFCEPKWELFQHNRNKHKISASERDEFSAGTITSSL